MELHLGCAHLNDDEFLLAFEQCRLNPAQFHHADHLRLAWLCVARYGPALAEEKLLSGIQRFAEKAGVPQKFLHTTTVAWVRLVAARHAPAVCQERFEDWIARWPELLNKNLLEQHYSASILQSREARSGWVDPDRKCLD
jgi:hypothetical protein